MSALPDAEQLLTLLAVAEAGNESAAAQHLGVGQSSVSRRLAALQRLSGAPLTQRTAAGTRLTPAGEALLGAARDVRAALHEAAGGLAPERRPATTLRVGISPHLVPRLAGGLSDPSQAGLELVEDHSHALLGALREGTMQAAITLAAPAGGEPGLEQVQVGEERLALAALPGRGPTQDAGALGLVRWLLSAPPSVVGDRARLLLRRAGLGAAPQALMPSPAATRAAVLAGAGVAVVLRSELRAEAAAGWIGLSPLPLGATGDDVMPVWLLLADGLAPEPAGRLRDLTAEAMRG